MILQNIAIIIMFGAILTTLIYKVLSKKLAVFSQSVRTDVLAHHSNKEGTPTMGGLFLILPVLALPIITGFNLKTLSIIFAVFAFAKIGALDDFLKIKRGRGKGLSAKHKTMLMLSATIINLSILYFSDNSLSSWLLPFSHKYYNLGIASWPLAILVVLGTANSVNLTDGLDGLALMPSAIVFLALALIACVFGNTTVAYAAALLFGSSMALLWFNVYPAKIFLGDTGSLAIGAVIAILALNLNFALILPLIGWLFVIETMSVILQVISFKLFKRRIIKMSPIHHHFELLGWHECNVVSRFWVLNLLIVVFIMLLEVASWLH